MEIQYWSDYACPFCYIGETALKTALKEMGLEEVPVTMRAFELDPNPDQETITDIVQYFADKYGISKEQAMERINDIHEMAADAGLSFDYTGVQKGNTFDAHRLTKLAAEKGLENEASELLYQAYFDEHRDLNDLEVLLDIAQKLGLNREETQKALESDSYSKDVRLDEFVSSQIGVQGVPFFVINGEVAIPGAISSAQWKEILPKYL